MVLLEAGRNETHAVRRFEGLGSDLSRKDGGKNPLDSTV
jgi:hypothetical protein